MPHVVDVIPETTEGMYAALKDSHGPGFVDHQVRPLPCQQPVEKPMLIRYPETALQVQGCVWGERHEVEAIQVEVLNLQGQQGKT